MKNYLIPLAVASALTGSAIAQEPASGTYYSRFGNCDVTGKTTMCRGRFDDGKGEKNYMGFRKDGKFKLFMVYNPDGTVKESYVVLDRIPGTNPSRESIRSLGALLSDDPQAQDMERLYGQLERETIKLENHIKEREPLAIPKPPQ